MTDTIDRFIAEHGVGLSDDRVKRLQRTLLDFERHSGVPIETTTDEHLRTYMTALAGQYHPNTIRQRAGCIRPFFRWAARNGFIDAADLMRVRDVPNPRGSTNQTLPRPYKRTELAIFWRQLEARWPLDETGKWLRRFREGKSPYRRVWPHATRLQLEAIVHLALHGGLRRNEIFGAGLDDIHYDNAYVVVRGAAKGAHAGQDPLYREVPHTEDSRRAIHAWLELREQLLAEFGDRHDAPWLVLHPSASPNNPILPSSPAGPMRHRAFKDQLSTVGAWELHRLRHTCGTEWLRAGMELEHVSKLLGHSNITQTLGYAQIVSSDVQRAAARAEADFSRALRPRDERRAA